MAEYDDVWFGIIETTGVVVVVVVVAGILNDGKIELDEKANVWVLLRFITLLKLSNISFSLGRLCEDEDDDDEFVFGRCNEDLEVDIFDVVSFL